MSGLLSGRIAIITGGARGLGAAVARLFVQEGAHAVVADVLDTQGAATAKDLGTAATYRHLDVTQEDSWNALVAEIEASHGGIDVLVNNAGIARFSALENTSLTEYLQVVNVNQVGTFLGMRSVIPSMKRRGGGSIINVSSTAGLEGNADLIAYCASKWAVRGMTKTAAMELGKHGIRVNSIHPGIIETEMTHDRRQASDTQETDRYFQRLAIPRPGTPEDVSRMALFLASSCSGYTTGSEFLVDGGYFNCKPSA